MGNTRVSESSQLVLLFYFTSLYFFKVDCPDLIHLDDQNVFSQSFPCLFISFVQPPSWENKGCWVKIIQ